VIGFVALWFDVMQYEATVSAFDSDVVEGVVCPVRGDDEVVVDVLFELVENAVVVDDHRWYWRVVRYWCARQPPTVFTVES